MTQTAKLSTPAKRGRTKYSTVRKLHGGVLESDEKADGR